MNDNNFEAPSLPTFDPAIIEDAKAELLQAKEDLLETLDAFISDDSIVNDIVAALDDYIDAKIAFSRKTTNPLIG